MTERYTQEAASFGQGKPVFRRRRIWRVVVFGIICASVVIGVPKGVAAFNRLYDAFGEKEPPAIEVLKPPPGIGLHPAELNIQVTDAQSGIDEVVVRVEQAGKTHELERKQYKTRLKRDVLKLSINGKVLKLNEGPAKFIVKAYDKSFWSNSAQNNFSLDIDYGVPKLEVLTTQHNAVRTGVELVFYRVQQDSKAFSAVVVGGSLFPGFPALKLDEAFDGIKDLRFALFAVPQKFDDAKNSIRILARDAVGNDSTASMYYRIQERNSAALRENVAMPAVHEFVETMYGNFLRDESRIRGTKLREFFPAVSDEERVSRFRELNTTYRELVEQALEELFLHPKSERYWEGRFFLPPGPKLPYRVGDRKEFFVDGVSLGSTEVRGVEFDLPAGREIRASNAGKVIYADALGLYGKTVIIDHGFGLTSLYGNLSEIKCTEGDEIKGGALIAISGRSAVTGLGRLEFQIRLHGVPVRPDEWWDESWIRGHIEDKIALVKKQFGIKVATPLADKPL